MSIFYAVIMGLIQGVTEFLPVSSSGHLAIFSGLFHIETPGMLFDVLLHVGTLIAVILCFYRDIGKLLAELLGMIVDLVRNLNVWFSNLTSESRRSYVKIVSNGYRKFDLLMLVATIPTGIIGVWDASLVEKLGSILLAPGICLIGTGFLLMLCERIRPGDKTPRNTTYSNAFMIGIAQGIATLPGVSRSGMTLTACLGSSFKRNYAVRFTFILSIPAILGSLIFELGDVDLSQISSGDAVSYIIGMAVAAVVGFFCIRVMLVIVRRQRFLPFSIYCFALGAVAIVAWLVQK
ncbi:MAG: undecaprenyl-diphosphate phosphatase [Lachnospiraceae bacterium]|nr:undecaprenyl-diphosphate phosphatase [Lachnospiraceae bacterium]